MSQPAPSRRRGRPALGAGPPVDDAQCLMAALRCFATQGFAGASLRDIAREAGVSHGLLTAKFGAKDSLWQAAIGYGMEQLHARMSAGEKLSADGDIAAQMHRACVDFLHGVADFPAIFQIMNHEGANPGARLDHIVAQFFRGRNWPFVSLLQAGQRTGLFRPVHPAVPFTLLAHGGGALVGLLPLMQAVDHRLSASPTASHAMIEAAADIIVQGLRA